MKNIPLSRTRLIHETDDLSDEAALLDNLGMMLDRAAALAATLEQIDPGSDSVMMNHGDQHPFRLTAYAIWLELQDAKAYLDAFGKAEPKKMRAVS